MPKKVHDMVDKMLDNPDFYPEKSKKDQESIAWAIATKNYKKKKKKSENLTEEIRVSNKFSRTKFKRLG